jgi:hypothetical protein
MRGDVELAGFVITQAEWSVMDRRQRAQLVRAALRRDEPWVPMAVVPEATPRNTCAPNAVLDDGDYEHYEVSLAPA